MLVKLASFKEWVVPIKMSAVPIAQHTVLGGTLGAIVGNSTNLEKNHDGSIKYRNGIVVRKPGTNTKKRILTGATIGAGIGGLGTVAAAAYVNKNYYQNLWKQSRQQVNNLTSFFKTYGGIPHSKVKTKKQAKDIYRAATMRYHPDLHPGDKKAEAHFKDLATSWEKVKADPWFEKLAMIINKGYNYVD